MKKTYFKKERRSSNRVLISTNARFQIAREIGGIATVNNVDQGGICLESPISIAPGKHIMIEIDEPAHGNGTFEVKGKVAWCSKSQDGYRLGIRVFSDIPDVRLVLSALMCTALKKQAAIEKIRDKNFVYVEWKMFGQLESTETSELWKPRKMINRAPRGILALGF